MVCNDSNNWAPRKRVGRCWLRRGSRCCALMLSIIIVVKLTLLLKLWAFLSSHWPHLWLPLAVYVVLHTCTFIRTSHKLAAGRLGMRLPVSTNWLMQSSSSARIEYVHKSCMRHHSDKWVCPCCDNLWHDIIITTIRHGMYFLMVNWWYANLQYHLQICQIIIWQQTYCDITFHEIQHNSSWHSFSLHVFVHRPTVLRVTPGGPVSGEEDVVAPPPGGPPRTEVVETEEAEEGVSLDYVFKYKFGVDTFDTVGE